MSHDRTARLALASSVLLAAFLALAVESTASAQAQPAAPPRVNVIEWYEVDPAWPQRPEGVKWGQTSGIAVDAQDQVWVYTRAKPPIQVYTTQGKFLYSFGDDLIGAAHYLKFDSQGMVWVADVTRHVVRQFTPKGELLKTLGTPDEPGDDQRHFNKPTDMTITPAGDVFVADGYGNSRVVHFDKEGKFVKAWGSAGTGPGQFNTVHAIAADSQGRLYVADRSNVRVQVFDQNGKFLAEWRNLLVPWGFWISKTDEIWVCGSSPMIWADGTRPLGCPPKDQLFMKFDPSGRLLQLWTMPKGEDGKEKPGEVNWLHGMTFDRQGNLYACDIIGQRAQKFLRKR